MKSLYRVLAHCQPGAIGLRVVDASCVIGLLWLQHEQIGHHIEIVPLSRQKLTVLASAIVRSSMITLHGR